MQIGRTTLSVEVEQRDSTQSGKKSLSQEGSDRLRINQENLLLLFLIVGVLVTALSSRAEQWQHLSIFLLFLGLAVVAMFMTVKVQDDLKFFGDFLPILMCAVLLGPAPAVVIAASATFAKELRLLILRVREKSAVETDGEPIFNALPDLVIAGWSTLAAGLLFHYMVGKFGLNYLDPPFYAVFLFVFVLALAINLVAWDVLWDYWVKGNKLGSSLKVTGFLAPVEVVTAIFALIVLYGYYAFGEVSTLILAAPMAVMLFTYWVSQSGLVSKKLRMFNKLTKRLGGLYEKDNPMGTHSAAVAQYCYEIAAEAGHSLEVCLTAYRVGLVHDIGKTDWPHDLLSGDKKRDDLTAEDMRLIKTHTIVGADRIKEAGLDELEKAILHHHEDIDGSGYPDRLKGDEIPELSRIIRVADTFDCVTARDSYQAPRSQEKALEILRGQGQFDQSYVAALKKALDDNPQLRFRHKDRQSYESAVDFYRNGLRRKRRPGAGGADSKMRGSEV